MDGFHFEARGYHAPSIQVHTRYGRVIIRVDDDRNPEAWTLIDMTDEFLLKLLRELNSHNEPIARILAELEGQWELSEPTTNGVVDVTDLFRLLPLPELPELPEDVAGPRPGSLPNGDGK